MNVIYFYKHMSKAFLNICLWQLTQAIKLYCNWKNLLFYFFVVKIALWKLFMQEPCLLALRIPVRYSVCTVHPAQISPKLGEKKSYFEYSLKPFPSQETSQVYCIRSRVTPKTCRYHFIRLYFCYLALWNRSPNSAQSLPNKLSWSAWTMFMWSLRFLALANGRWHVSQTTRGGGGSGELEPWVSLLLVTPSSSSSCMVGRWLAAPLVSWGAPDWAAKEQRDLWAFLDSRLNRCG